MCDQFKKIMQIAKETGDRFIILNDNGDPQFVILPFSQYQRIGHENNDVTKMSEEEFLERIDRDIAVWRSAQEDENISNFEFSFSKKDEKREEPDEEVMYFEPID